MAKAVYICARDPRRIAVTEGDLQRLGARLAPDNIKPSCKTVVREDGIAFSVFTPSEAVMVRGASVALGVLEAGNGEWWRPGSDVPDGAYALFRGGRDMVELVSDFVASRTIWYFHNREIFIAATSQRAIIACLRSYEPDPKVYPWVLSNGYFGPGLSWDRRIRKMRGNSRVVLDRRTWELTERSKPAVFEPAQLSDEEHERRMENALQTTFDNLHLDWGRWVLSLSGGYDSRCSLGMLADRTRIKCITWSVTDRLEDTGGDAYIAGCLARKYGLEHEYFITDVSNEPVDLLLDRVLMANEGRIDHVNASVDGYERYRKMNESGILGLIRSDVGFSSRIVILKSLKADLLFNMGLRMLSDYSNADALGSADFEPQDVPDNFRQLPGESLLTWRDRLHHEFRIPCVLAALAEPRLNYIEQANPLLSRRVTEAVRALPDTLRGGKILYKKIIDRIIPDVPIADRTSIAPLPSLLSRLEQHEVFRDVLMSSRAKSLLPAPLLSCTGGFLTRGPRRLAPKSSIPAASILKILSKPFKQTLRSLVYMVHKPSLSPEQSIFRSFVIVRMHQILNEDAQCLKRP